MRRLPTSPKCALVTAASVAIAAGVTALPARFGTDAQWLLALAVGEAAALALLLKRRLDAEARLASQAGLDPLTGLPNRVRFLERLGVVLSRSGRRGRPALLFLDLDRFKFVNDSLGHAAGDRLLVEVADRLRRCVRPSDLVARIGADEFTVLLDGRASPTEAEAVAARLADELQAPFTANGVELAITASIGIALAAPGQDDPSELLRDADSALSRAKERGKARWVVFDPEMRTDLRERAELEADLAQAPTRGELWLAYQPVVDLASGSVVGLEALVRWQHPKWGLLNPGQFIPLAEETGQVEEIGRWVMAKACRQARAWQSQFEAPPVVAINLSARQFQRPDLVDVLDFMLNATGLDPRLLKLEITESAVMADAEAAVETLRRLKELGVGLAIDDFGTGYSSLNYLRRFPVDALKIDKAFVAGLGRDEGDAAIAEAVVGLAHTMGLKVVAEGIETAEQLGILRAMGCEQGQGFRFGRPQPPASVEQFFLPVDQLRGAVRRLAS